MSKLVHPLALFRLTVLGELASRQNLQRGEVKKIVRELSCHTFQIPGSRRVHLSEQTILRWYYDWKRHGIEGLVPKSRSDKGSTQLPENIKKALLDYKKDNPARSINTLISLLTKQGLVERGKLSRATVHRFLNSHALSKRILADKKIIERRSFVAQHCGDIWQGDVLHGPAVQTSAGMRKTYLVSLMDDASRLITHSEFCLGETALEIEGVLKQAILKRGLPHKLLIDNGAAYRAASLQSICAILEIRLIHCRPYEPEGKGKLEKFHRTFREQFLNEINLDKIANLPDLNARLWAWLDHVYHQRPHQGLQGKTPIDRWREDLIQVRQLGFKAAKLNDIFLHRTERLVRKDGTIRWEGTFYEAGFELVDKKVILVFDPHSKKALRVESVFGDDLGSVVPLNKIANLHRKRQRPHTTLQPTVKHEINAVEIAFQERNQLLEIPSAIKETDNTQENE